MSQPDVYRPTGYIPQIQPSQDLESYAHDNPATPQTEPIGAGTPGYVEGIFTVTSITPPVSYEFGTDGQDSNGPAIAYATITEDPWDLLQDEAHRHGLLRDIIYGLAGAGAGYASTEFLNTTDPQALIITFTVAALALLYAEVSRRTAEEKYMTDKSAKLDLEHTQVATDDPTDDIVIYNQGYLAEKQERRNDIFY